MEKTIKINIPDGYDDVKFNETTNEIEFIKKGNKPKKPRSWEEYCENVKYTPCYIANFGHSSGWAEKSDRLHCPSVHEFNTKEEAKAVIALCKLIQLRDAWWAEWRPDWNNSSKIKHVICSTENKICRTWNCTESRILAFPTEKMRDDFLKTFRDLIEEAKSLL